MPNDENDVKTGNKERERKQVLKGE